jgi:hypothetical protein
MRLLRESVVLAVLLAAGSIHSAPAVSDPELAKGIAQVKQGEYELGVLTLDGFVRKVADPAARAEEVGEALLYLGAAYVQLGEETLARGKFREALSRRPGLTAEGRGFSEKVLALFAAVRNESRPPASGVVRGGLSLDHPPVGCVVAGRFSLLTARVDPMDALARGRVFFRADATPAWYFVEMKPESGGLSAALPRAKSSLKRINYYVEVIDKSSVVTRTQEFAPEVAGSPAECSRAMAMAPAAAAPAEILVTPAPGAPPVPFGFDPSGIVGAATSAPTATSAAAAAKAGSGATKILLIGGGVALAGAAVAVAGGGGDNGTPVGNNPPPPVSQTPTTTAPTTTTTLPAPTNNRPPEVSCRTNPANPQGVAPLRIAFNCCTSRDAENDPLTYGFDFGDGDGVSTMSCGPREHSYALGTWTARICVTDGFAGHETCPTFEIRARAPSPSPPPGYLQGWVNRAIVESDLKLAGGVGQVVINGQIVFFPGEGRADLSVPTQAQNYVEATVVRGQGRPGTWRLTVSHDTSAVAAVRVIAGEVLSATTDSIVFRLTGEPGQRIALSFGPSR